MGNMHQYVQGQADNEDKGGCTSVYFYVHMFMYRVRMIMKIREVVQVYIFMYTCLCTGSG